MHRRLALLPAALLLALAAALVLMPESGRGPATERKTVPQGADRPARAAADPSDALGRPLAVRVADRPVPTAATAPVPGAPAPLPVAEDFLDEMVVDDGSAVRFPLPGGGTVTGNIELIERDGSMVVMVQGRLDSPAPGFFYFRREPLPGVAGALSGHVRFDEGTLAYRVEPAGEDGAPLLLPRTIDQVMCVGLPAEPAPQDHPVEPPFPPSQNGIVPLESLPGAAAVVFLDFEGGPGPWEGWGDFPVEPATLGTQQIKEVWQRVAEDFQPFTINVTTDRRVFEAAARNTRQRVMVTPTNTASPGNGGVALYGSFNSSGDAVCWSFYTSGKAAAEVISHEIGHTLSLSHDGRHAPGQERQEYFDGSGYGSGATDWAPIMGVGYGPNLTQWSKGEYDHATNTEDDLAIITNNNNSVDYRADDFGSSHATAGRLEVFADGSVDNEGIIERTNDVDAFRFTTRGGPVSFRVDPVEAGPNVDLQLSIRNASGAQLASNNPLNELTATVSANLAAGEYTLRVAGVGRGNARTDGYSSYASLGAYLISGSAPDAEKPDRFTLAENPPSQAPVGTVTPRNNHGGAILRYQILPGEDASAFAIHGRSGQINVADRTAFDYEALSSQWGRPAQLELSVSITNESNPSLNEIVRVVVTVSDVNEAPVVSAASKVLFSRTRAGTEVLTVAGEDPDRGDFLTWSIVSDPSGSFAIDADSGRLTVAEPPDVEGDTVFPVVVRATDSRSPARSGEATLELTVRRLVGNHRPGGIPRTYYEGIGGNYLPEFINHPKFPNGPDSQEALASFDGGTHGENYGSTITGYLIPPVTGTYTFWIASDDSSELRLSTDANPANASARASLQGAVGRYAFDQTGSQKSAAISLLAGRPYYIEARHKEGVGGDYVAVAWEGPGFSREVIPALYLAPHSANRAPSVPPATLQVRRDAYAGAIVGKVVAEDFNPLDSHHFRIVGGTGAALFGIYGETGEIYVRDAAALAAAGSASYALAVRASDDGTPAMAGSGTITLQPVDPGAVNAEGIVRQIWRSFGGNLAQLPDNGRFNTVPDLSRTLTSFDAGSEGFEYYGSRIRAHVVPPVTGTYRFYISSDDESALYLGTGASAATATQVAGVNGWVDPRGWDAQAGQASVARTLIAGNRYYIEVRHRQGFGGDDLAVAWTGPGIASPQVIPGAALRPFDINNPPVWNSGSYTLTARVGSAAGTAIGQVAASDPEGEPLVYAIVSGNASGAFAIDPASGVIRVAEPTALVPGANFQLAVGAQDGGLGGVYPRAAAVRNVTISVNATATPTMEVRRDAVAGTPVGRVDRAAFPSLGSFTFTGGTGASIYGIDPESGLVRVKDAAALAASTAGSHTLTVATGGNIQVQITIAVIDAGEIRASGIVRQTWRNFTGSLADLANDPRYPHRPDVSRNLASFEAGFEGVSNFGSRIRAYVVPPVTGSYRFYISSDDASVLRLGTGADPSTAADIAAVNGWVDPRNWTAYASQASTARWLVAGTRYYIEVRHRQGIGGDDLAVAWTGPGIAGPEIIPASALQPFDLNAAPVWSAAAGTFAAAPGDAAGKVLGKVSATDPEGEPLVYAIVSGNDAGAFAIDPATGAITVADSAALAVGTHPLIVAAQDAGLGGVYPLGQTTMNVSIEVAGAFASWQLQHFGENPGASGSHAADPDADGLPNLLEYALGLDPRAPDPAGIVAQLAQVNGQPHLRISVARDPAASDVELSAELSDGMSGWSAADAVVEIDTADAFQARDVHPAASRTTRFIRLRAALR